MKNLIPSILILLAPAAFAAPLAETAFAAPLAETTFVAVAGETNGFYHFDGSRQP